MAMAFRMKAGGFIRAGSERVSMRGSDLYRRQSRRGVHQQPVSMRIGRAGVGAAASAATAATAAAIAFAFEEEGRLNGTSRPSLILRDIICGPLGLVKVVHADAAPPVKIDEDGLPELAEGEKPELIKQADAEVGQFSCSPPHMIDAFSCESCEGRPPRISAKKVGPSGFIDGLGHETMFVAPLPKSALDQRAYSPLPPLLVHQLLAQHAG